MSTIRRAKQLDGWCSTVLACLLSGLLVAACAAPHGAARQPEPATGQPRLQVLDQGRELAYRGPITFEATALLADFLGKYPIQLVTITSEGGYLGPALEMSQLLLDQGVTTFVPTRCLSGCTLLFLAGGPRFVGPGAALGFHRSAPVHELPEGAVLRYGDADLGAWMAARGVAEEFIARVLATPATTLWFPSHRELRDAGVIDAVLPRERLPDHAP